jgi:hypothetical protein
MGRLVNLRIYDGRRAARGRGPRDAGLWACSECANHTWVLTALTEIRCAECGTRAVNLAAVATCAEAGATH